MKCDACGAEFGPSQSGVVPYRCGLPNVTLVNVQVRRCTACDNYAVDIPHVDALHRCLAHAVATRVGRLGAAEIKFLRKFLGLAGKDLAVRFKVEPETVSRWETGARPIPGPAEGLLRVLALCERPVQDYAALDGLLLRTRKAGPANPKVSATPRGDTWAVEIGAA